MPENLDSVNEVEKVKVANEYFCITCGDTLTYSGRGKPPSYCDRHKKSTATGSSSGSFSLDAGDLSALVSTISTILTSFAMGSASYLSAKPPTILKDDLKEEWIKAYNAINLSVSECQIISDALIPVIKKNKTVSKGVNSILGVTNSLPVLMIAGEYALRLKEALPYRNYINELKKVNNDN